jgi:hypothetical protein
MKAMFEKYDKRLLKRIPYFITQYKGVKEEMFMDTLVDKYGPEPSSKYKFTANVIKQQNTLIKSMTMT